MSERLEQRHYCDEQYHFGTGLRVDAPREAIGRCGQCRKDLCDHHMYAVHAIATRPPHGGAGVTKSVFCKACVVVMIASLDVLVQQSQGFSNEALEKLWSVN